MRKKRNSKKLRSALAILLAGSMMLGMVPGGMGQVYAADVETSVKEEQTGLLDKAKDFFSDMGEGIADFFTGESAEVEPTAAFDETSIVDKETSQGWRDIVEKTTRNIGRIWTDKSVYNNDVTLPGIGDTGHEIPITKPETSDFMVGLSVLSSTSNTSVTTSTPLDIVLVLDVSGSMSENIETYDYRETYRINKYGSTKYYAKTESGTYVKVDRKTKDWSFEHWEVNGEKVDPKTESDDPDTSHVQFYERVVVKRTERMQALKDAANAFVDATVEQNRGIKEKDQHRISVVSFSDNGQVRRQLTVCNDTNAAGLKRTINGLRTGGNTYPENAMKSAEEALTIARDKAQKVVIFFTDGNPAPAGSNDFNEGMADAGVQGALKLKNINTKIYSIGIFEGADPGNTSTDRNNQFNAYMHAMSSNFPKATAWNQHGNPSTDGLDYYYAATSAEELAEIFQKISSEINSGTGYPTDTEAGFENRDGYVTFHDQLGDYMQVDSFNDLVLNDITFSAKPAEAEGKIKYTYSGEVDLNGDGKKESVSDIVIEVTPGAGSMGDTVDVRIPAALLPLRHFKVDVSGNTMTVEDKYPLRLFYNVSLKEDAKKALANPDQEMKNYITNKSKDGNVYFYSNKFTGNKQGSTEGETLGDTTATFEPASGNSFYYFTENTPLWTDEEMTDPVTSYSAQQGQDTYYYEKTYYKLDNGAPKKVTEAVSFRSHSRDEVEGWVGTATDGQLYIKAGAPRLTRIHDLTSSKEINATETATEVITPNWDDEQAQRNIEVSLGNNGRLAVELPGTLEIKKTVTSEVEAPKDKKFTFTLTLKDANGEALTGEFDAQKFDAQGVESGEPVTVQNNGTVTLKDGESVKIYGLSNGDTYNIQETQIPKGFTAKENPIKGTIKGNGTVTAAFENTYAVTPVVLEGDSSIRAKKTLTGRDWEDGDSFEIILRAQGGAPLPEASEGITIDTDNTRAVKTVTNGDTFSFGKITFDKPGTYVYNVAEPAPTPDKEIPGINYSGAVYRVDVVVTDNGEGVLSATSTMTQVLDEMGHAIEGGGTNIEDGIASFTNHFEASSVEWQASARKIYIDKSGAKPLQKGDFTFRVEAVVDDIHPEKGPLPGGADSYEVTNGLGGEISFGQATFGTEHYGKTYLYKISEVLPEGVSAENPTKDGMTYDTNVYYLELFFDSTENPYDPDNQIMTVTPKYMNANMEVIPDLREMVFTNTYEPTPVDIGDITDTAIKGSKTLNGRAMKEDEFSFELTAGNQAAVNGLADDSIVFGEDNASASMTATAPAADNGAKADFAFGQITFTKPGTYIFNMKEVIPEQAAGGLTYDTHTEVVTVTVTDNNGVLTANTTYDGDGAAFVNTYEAFHSYSADGGALVTKTLTGRDMKAGEFNFAIEGTGDNAVAANKKLADTDKSFTNYAAKANAPSEMRKLQNVPFTEANAGQTFTYLIKEVIPADDKKAGGVTYDQSEFTLAIAVADDGDGTMSTTTTVTRTKAADGTNVNEIVGTYTSAAGIIAVPFVNTYKAAPVIVDTSDTEGNVRLSKVLRGRDWHEGESFEFTMTPQNGAPIPAADEAAGITVDDEGNVHAVVTRPENGVKDGEQVYFGFGEITYDTAGTYVYTVKEDVPNPKAGGMTYSKNVATITVTVTDPGTGKLDATVMVDGSESDRRFYNDYAASLNLGAAGGLAITKTLTGHALAKEQFEFKVKAVTDEEEGTATVEEAAELFGFKKGETEVTFKNNEAAADGQTVTMLKTDTNFTLENLGKVYKYEVSETDDKKPGYTYDNTVYTVELWVTDDGDGTLTLHAKVTDQDDKVISDETSDETHPKETVLAFNNSYAATGELDGNTKLEVTKNLQGRDWLDSDSFSFKLEATGETAQAVEDKIVTLPENAIVINGSDKDKKASFGNIGFTKPGTYTFQVTEAVPEGAVNNVLNGITYDSSVKNITVNVTDNNAGELIAAVAEESDVLTFTNTYATSTVTLGENEQFKVTKNLVGRGWTDDDKFKFTLTAKDGAPMPAVGGNVVIATNAEKTQKFGEITYEAAGTYEYQITETVPENPEEGMTYDRHPATVTVKVTEDYATGTLSVESVTYSDGADGAKFTNVLGKNTKEVTSGNQDVNNGMVGVGDELTYVINWVNDGVDETGAPAAATVKVTDIIPTGTEYVEESAEGAEYDADARTLTWTIDADAAQTGSVSFKVVVTDNAGGTEIENEGKIKVGENDSKVTNIVKTTVPGKKETTNPDKIEDGTILTYEIKFRNTDGENATATVVDKMTPGLEYQVGTATVNDQVSDPNVEGDSATGQTLTWNLEGLADNAKVTITFNVKVTRDALDSVDNSATVNGHKSNVVTTPYPSDDKKTVEDKDGNDQNNGMVGVGDELTYVIDWAADEAGKVTITDIVPTGTEFVSAENGGVHENGTVTWVIKDAKKGQKGSVSFTVKVTGEAGGKDVLNKADVKVGNNKPKVTNEVKTFIPGKDSALAEGDTELQVGDVLTYTIFYKNPEDTAATVTITDKLPEGLTFVEASNDGGYANGTLTWTLENVPAGEKGTVSFKASVNENAKKEIENKATIQVGENSPKYSTDTDGKTLVEDGNLAISKTIAMTEGQGTKIDTEKEFTFTVTLKDTAGKDLTKQYAYTIKNGDKEVSTGNVKHNGTLKLKHGETATITGLPSGAQYTVTETPEAGYTSDKENNTVTGTIPTKETATADFTNTYSVTGSLTGAESLKVTKNFTGREGNQWLESDAFTFTLTAADDKATQDAIKAGLITLTDPAEITIDGTMAEKQAAFGNITFNIAGTFKFNVTEQESNIDGVTDDANRVRKIVVNVVDNKDGTLKATIAEGSDNLTFTNTYGAGSGENDIAAQIQATKKLTGRDMQDGEFDFEVVTRKTPEYTGNFTPVVVATGTNEAAAEGAEGGVTFAGYDGNGKMNLVYTTESLNQAVTDGYAIKAVVDGKTVWTVNYTARELTNNLPKGVTSIVEKTAFDFTVVVTDNTDGTLTAEVQYPNGAITFENTYATGGTIVDTDPTDANAFFYKVLEGRDWLEKDAFTFTIEPQDGAPAPINAEGNPVTKVTVTKADLKDGKAPFGFGKIHFTDANMGTASEKTFMYHVKENDIDAEAMPGVSKDTHTAKFSITLTDDGEGTLSAATPVVTEGIFTNRYESSLDYNEVGGLQISKVLNGRDMQKDQFTFTLTPKATEGSTTAEEAAQKLGFAEVKAYEFKNEAAAMGEATYMNVLSGKEVVFTQADAGKTYTYEIVEVKGQNEAYKYDEAVNIVTITVVDNNNGTLTVTTTVTKNGEVVDTKVVSTGDAEAAPATAQFVNVYNDVPGSLGGEGSVAINATKSLTNRPMADEEFTFHVTDKNGVQVATGNNDASGKITFTPIEYTTDTLNADAETGTATKSYDAEKDAYTYTYQYKVEEDLNNVDEGVTGIVTAFSIQVVVTDDGNGNLTIAVVYPDGKDSLPFENAYGTSAEAAIHVNGQKVLNVESGNNAPDITGKYIFTLSGSDGAPMPEKATANNDAAGNVDFGKITYTMQNVFGDTGVTAEAEGTEEALTEVMPVSDTRTKTFTYTVTESETVKGVTNDAESVKTFNVTVTDNGDGTIKVDKDYTGFEFGFTNTYHVEPVDFDINDAEAGITVKKELAGRAMNAGEFVFELISDKDKSVREAVNDTDGNVKFETMNFTAPGEYIYTLRERNTKLGGVDYDTTEYQVVVTVTDNGDGTMSAETKLADEGKDVVFKNQYEAAPTSVMFGASKIYKGADLKDGQFTFVVKDADGNVVSEAKNNKDGMVTFDTIEFNEEGTYTFTISEKNDKQKNVTYDKAVYEVTVTVTDNGEGSLIAEVAYADGKAPVFTNKYTKPAEPSKPEEPKKPGAVQTGDSTPIVGLVVAMVVALAAIVAVAVIFFRRRRR